SVGPIEIPPLLPDVLPGGPALPSLPGAGDRSPLKGLGQRARTRDGSAASQTALLDYLLSP
ncbi:MAG: hypothetical protein H0V81_06250, partial [Solirubrobacterales bacterium]|nr:hypothetical protein [Solirubrobacterales bacterium]